MLGGVTSARHRPYLRVILQFMLAATITRPPPACATLTLGPWTTTLLHSPESSSSPPPTVREAELSASIAHASHAPACPLRYLRSRQGPQQLILFRRPGNRSGNHCPAPAVRLAHLPPALRRMVPSERRLEHCLADVRRSRLATLGLGDLAASLRVAGLGVAACRAATPKHRQ
jgi:hypothetical protein